MLEKNNNSSLESDAKKKARELITVNLYNIVDYEKLIVDENKGVSVSYRSELRSGKQCKIIVDFSEEDIGPILYIFELNMNHFEGGHVSFPGINYDQKIIETDQPIEELMQSRPYYYIEGLHAKKCTDFSEYNQFLLESEQDPLITPLSILKKSALAKAQYEDQEKLRSRPFLLRDGFTPYSERITNGLFYDYLCAQGYISDKEISIYTFVEKICMLNLENPYMFKSKFPEGVALKQGDPENSNFPFDCWQFNFNFHEILRNSGLNEVEANIEIDKFWFRLASIEETLDIRIVETPEFGGYNLFMDENGEYYIDEPTDWNIMALILKNGAILTEVAPQVYKIKPGRPVERGLNSLDSDVNSNGWSLEGDPEVFLPGECEKIDLAIRSAIRHNFKPHGALILNNRNDQEAILELISRVRREVSKEEGHAFEYVMKRNSPDQIMQNYEFTNFGEQFFSRQRNPRRRRRA